MSMASKTQESYQVDDLPNTNSYYVDGLQNTVILLGGGFQHIEILPCPSQPPNIQSLHDLWSNLQGKDQYRQGLHDM